MINSVIFEVIVDGAQVGHGENNDSLTGPDCMREEKQMVHRPVDLTSLRPSWCIYLQVRTDVCDWPLSGCCQQTSVWQPQQCDFYS